MKMKNSLPFKTSVKTSYNSSTNRQQCRLAIFGISGNPPTGMAGHTGIVSYLANSKLYDEVWIHPVYQHMYQLKTNMESFEHRINMCELAMSVHTNNDCQVRILDTEKVVFHHLNGENGHASTEPAKGNTPTDKFGTLTAGVSVVRAGTVDVLEYLLAIYDDTINVHLILGTDTAADLLSGKWKRSLRILEIANIDCIKRAGYASSNDSSNFDGYENYKHCKMRLHNIDTLTNVSSSLIRGYKLPILLKLSLLVSTKLALCIPNQLIVTNALDKKVFEYILRNRLYFFTSNDSNTNIAVVISDSATTATSNNSISKFIVRLCLFSIGGWCVTFLAV